eukprot:364980-Chlamydomonas_euryale.AAC.3
MEALQLESASLGDLFSDTVVSRDSLQELSKFSMLEPSLMHPGGRWQGAPAEREVRVGAAASAASRWVAARGGGTAGGEGWGC